jgi:cell shape-determining protein MreC
VDSRLSTLRPRLSPPFLLAGLLAVAVGLMLVPRGWVDAMKGAAAVALEPGQRAMLRVRDWTGGGIAVARAQLALSAELAETQRRIRRLEQENHLLRAELLAERSRRSDQPEHAIDKTDQPLLRARCVPARVLGHQARTFLVDQKVLDVGLDEGVRRDALVVQPPIHLIDLGGGAGIQPDQWVLSGGRVWGKVVEVSRQTSTVLTLTEPGYRDLVRLADADSGEGPPRLGPEGILEGTGEPLARIRLVPVTEPVAVGDAVYAAGGLGFAEQPLLCGHVARVERPVGASHWELWMQPAAPNAEPQEVVVVRAELNPARLAEKKGTSGLPNRR